MGVLTVNQAVAIQEQTEERSHLACPFEVKRFYEKKQDEGVFGFFEGYASVFGNTDGVMDIIEKGSFKETLKSGRTVVLCYQHDWWNPIGQFTELAEDSKGLYVTGRINLGTTLGKDVYALLKAGDLNSMSIGYTATKADYDREGDIRRITEIDLFEISVVTFPANEKAKITQVKAIEQAGGLAEIESILKRKGFTRVEAKTLISKVKEFSSGRDVLDEKGSEKRDVDQAKGVEMNDQRDVEAQKSATFLVESLQALVNNFKEGDN